MKKYFTCPANRHNPLPGEHEANGHMITDHQMITATIAYQGLVDAQQGLPPNNISNAYLESYAHEYEQGERDTANERPF